MDDQLHGCWPGIPDGSRPLNVIVVDDKEVIASTLVAILRREGLKATYFTDPLLALSSARVDSPDLLISDISMPHLSGVELAIQFKYFAPQCRVILFSGEVGHKGLLHYAHDLGHEFEILTKPIHPRELLERSDDQNDLRVCTLPNHLRLRAAVFPSSAGSPPHT